MKPSVQQLKRFAHWLKGMPDNFQLSFLSAPNQYSSLRFRSQEPQLEMSAERLQKWKQLVGDYQQGVRVSPTTQDTLFDLPRNHADLELIAPFALTRSSFQFYTWPNSRHVNEPVVYFVFDDQVPLPGSCQATQGYQQGCRHKLTDWQRFRQFVHQQGDKTQAQLTKL